MGIATDNAWTTQHAHEHTRRLVKIATKLSEDAKKALLDADAKLGQATTEATKAQGAKEAAKGDPAQKLAHDELTEREKSRAARQAEADQAKQIATTADAALQAVLESEAAAQVSTEAADKSLDKVLKTAQAVRRAAVKTHYSRKGSLARFTPWHVVGVGFSFGYDEAEARRFSKSVEAPTAPGTAVIEERTERGRARAFVTFHLHSPFPDFGARRRKGWHGSDGAGKFWDWFAWRPMLVTGIALKDARQHAMVGAGLYLAPGISVFAAGHRHPIARLGNGYVAGDLYPVDPLPVTIARHRWSPYVGVAIDTGFIIMLYQFIGGAAPRE